MRLAKAFVPFAVALALCCAGTVARAALSCSATIDNVSFGNVDTLSAPQADVTANVTMTCTGGVPIALLGILDVYACASIGTGSGGTNSGSRLMTGTPSGTLAYQLYVDSARTTAWGTFYGTAFGSVPIIHVPLNSSGNGSATVQLYARLPASSSPATPGSYLSSFTSAYTEFDYAQLTTLLACNINILGLGLSRQTSPTFAVSAQIDKNCLVDAADISFGSNGVLRNAVTANGRIGITCTPGTTYAISLGNGQTGTGPTQRRLVRGSAFVTYGLYQNAGFTQPWGNDTSPTDDRAAGTGDGAKHNLTVYGQVPAQSTPAAGTYTDMIVVTVSY